MRQLSGSWHCGSRVNLELLRRTSAFLLVPVSSPFPFKQGSWKTSRNSPPAFFVQDHRTMASHTCVNFSLLAVLRIMWFWSYCAPPEKKENVRKRAHRDGAAADSLPQHRVTSRSNQVQGHVPHETTQEQSPAKCPVWQAQSLGVNVFKSH